MKSIPQLKPGSIISLRESNHVVVDTDSVQDMSNADANFYNGGITRETFTTVPFENYKKPNAHSTEWTIYNPNLKAANMVRPEEVVILDEMVLSEKTTYSLKKKP